MGCREGDGLCKRVNCFVEARAPPVNHAQGLKRYPHQFNTLRSIARSSSRPYSEAPGKHSGL